VDASLLLINGQLFIYTTCLTAVRLSVVAAAAAADVVACCNGQNPNNDAHIDVPTPLHCTRLPAAPLYPRPCASLN